MTQAIALIGLLSLLCGFGLFKHYRDKKAGRNEEKVENLENENKKLKDRPHTLDDVNNRLQDFIDDD